MSRKLETYVFGLVWFNVHPREVELVSEKL